MGGHLKELRPRSGRPDVRRATVRSRALGHAASVRLDMGARWAPTLAFTVFVPSRSRTEPQPGDRSLRGQVHARFPCAAVRVSWLTHTLWAATAATSRPKVSASTTEHAPTWRTFSQGRRFPHTFHTRHPDGNPRPRWRGRCWPCQDGGHTATAQARMHSLPRDTPATTPQASRR